MGKRILLLFFASSMFVFSVCNEEQNEINMQPYLQGVTQNSVYVLLESLSRDTVKVEYDLDTGNIVTELIDGGQAAAFTTEIEETNGGTYVHNIHLTGLLPNSGYNYKVSQGTYQSKEYTFRTAVPEGTAFRFAWLADVRSGPDVHEKIAKYIIDYEPVVALYGGDLAVDYSYKAWKEDFFIPSQKELISNVPFFNAPGNHEGWNVNTKAFTQAPQSASGTQDFFSFDYGDMHVLVINNEIDYSYGSAQYIFAENDLKNSNKKWKVVMCHYPPYGAGGHDEDETMIAMAVNIFDKYNVDIVFSGHSHFYQHNKVGNIHYIISGSAGSPLYTPESSWYTIKSVRDYNFLICDVDPSKFVIKCYDDDNALIEEIILTK